MHLINHLKNVTSGEDYRSITYEVVSEAHISGVVDYQTGDLLIGGIAGSPRDGLNSYQIKIKPIAHLGNNSSINKRKGYFHPDGAIGEIVALLSIFYQARFYLVSSTFGELSERSIAGRFTYPIHRVQVDKRVDEAVFGNRVRNFVDFQVFLGQIVALNKEHHLPVITACTHYNRALKEIGVDDEMVFIRLVSAVEVLAKNFELAAKDDPLKSLNTGGFLKGLTERQRAGIASVLHNRNSALKFTQFVERYSKGYIKGGRPTAIRLKISKAKLPAILKTIYDARSRYLHDGEMMYLSSPELGYKFDIDPSLELHIGERRFTESQHLPNIAFFEGLVRHCILQYISELRSKSL